MTSAIEYYSNQLRFETDVSDVQQSLSAGAPGFVLIDTRNTESWDQGRIPGAIHLPTREIAARAAELVPVGRAVVTYCWGPGCNGATKAALEFAKLGYQVREMIGGYEYWVREGFTTEGPNGATSHPADHLTSPVTAACGC
ncbi:rhodanese-like domain-containing protein [Actinoplanes sp. NEAU-A12]|uniref:Rhodanese-like domain-containing protein n=1 Tax=Actinoplanes sandaracinus TaxID=3045177 RepID=A0ABT6WQD5_9ACTN|nr:rhodanese-like domain-containing protein [Actinoplanes sandaracinus]MDI6101940.1 rhodanese-like domain-containing protein [Actinoplanes sandaracinus]